MEIYKQNFFVYAVNKAVSGGTTSDNLITFDNDSDFILKEIRQTKQTAGAILMQLKLSNGKLFSNILIDSLLFGGNPESPVRFFENVIIPKNTQITVTLKNTTGGSLTHEVQLIGYQV